MTFEENEDIQMVKDESTNEKEKDEESSFEQKLNNDDSWAEAVQQHMQQKENSTNN